MDDIANPRAVVGDNQPPTLARLISDEQADFGVLTTAYLTEQYGNHSKIADALLDEARALPKVIEDDDTKGKVTSLIKRIKDEAKALDGLHGKESTPYYRGKQGADQFFFGLIDKLSRRNKTNNKGAADILLDRLTDYDTRKLAEEEARRKREADEAARIEREAQIERDRLAREADEARLAAERARAPAKIEEKTAAAVATEQAADAAEVDLKVASAKAEETHIATLAKPADIMRTRGSDGTLSTMNTEKFADIIDRAKLDVPRLAPFIPLVALEQALRAYAATVGYSNDASVQIEGAKFGKRPKSSVR